MVKVFSGDNPVLKMAIDRAQAAFDDWAGNQYQLYRLMDMKTNLVITESSCYFVITLFIEYYD